MLICFLCLHLFVQDAHAVSSSSSCAGPCLSEQTLCRLPIRLQASHLSHVLLSPLNKSYSVPYSHKDAGLQKVIICMTCLQSQGQSPPSSRECPLGCSTWSRWSCGCSSLFGGRRHGRCSNMLGAQWPAQVSYSIPALRLASEILPQALQQHAGRPMAFSGTLSKTDFAPGLKSCFSQEAARRRGTAAACWATLVSSGELLPVPIRCVHDRAAAAW